ncbi:MAG TPA: PAS domain S-box protein [Steroidobacteraceae bacterium]|nr:PAS domain S-box protein [Steroidobacteraceae bacterium]
MSSKPVGDPDAAAEETGATGLFRVPTAARPAVETLFRNTVEHAPVGIAYANPDGSFRHANLAFCAMLGHTAEELRKQSIESLTHAEDLASTRAGLERLWRRELTHLDVEKRYIRKNGSPLWVRVTTSLVEGASGKPECSVEFLRDISVRKEMAAALLQNQTLLSTVVGELPIALLSCDVRGQLTHYNRAACELFGIAAQSASGPRNPYPITSQVFLPDGKTAVPREARPLAQALRGEICKDVEFVIVRPDGATRIILSSSQRLIGPEGQPLGALAMVQDITERREAEEELERVHKQLLTASRQAGMAEVATNVLHNVGNVLNSVNVSASMVSERIKRSKCAGLGKVATLFKDHAADLAAFVGGPQGRHLPAYLMELANELLAERDAAVAELTALRSNVEHIKEIVAMQQGYARLGGITDTVDVRVLVDDSLRMNEGAFNRHGVTIVRDFEDVPMVRVDKHKVLQILVNVIRNAKYACSEAKGGGERRVTVRVRASTSAVLIAVIDTGVGIPRENLDKIFSYGFTTRAEGHGFGLHSSALAARELGGTLRAESPGPGMGATFTLTLPLATPEPVK